MTSKFRLRATVISCALLAFSATTTLFSQSLQANRVADNAEMGPMVQLSGHLPAWANPARDAGPVADETPLGLAIVVARSPAIQAAFEQLLADQQNPGSSRYHQWLTPEQIGAQFGPTQHDLDALTGWLASQGLRVNDITPSRIFVHVTGSASSVGRALQTNFRYFNSDGKARLSAATEPSVPAALAAVVGSISGLTDIELQPMHHIEMGTPTVPPGSVAPQYTSSSGNHYIFPADFATIFDLNPVYNAGMNGAGQNVAVIGRSQVSATDISEFETKAALPSNVPNTIVVPTGSDPGVVSGDEGESILDLTRVIGTAPGVTADFVISGTKNNFNGLYLAAQYEVQTLMDPAMTISYGACEANAMAAGVSLYSNLFSQAAAEGISVFISSADSGAATCDTQFAQAPAVQKLSINYICSNPYNTCVGGTELVDRANPTTFWSPTNGVGSGSALGYIPEGGWNEPILVSGGVTSYIVQASGGGASAIVPKPTWQTGVGVPNDGFRDVPDLSFPSSGHDGYFACLADFNTTGGGDCALGHFIVFSGTSAAAPAMAGFTALLNQKLGGREGLLNPLLYRLAATPSNNALHDTTPASSGVSPCDVNVPSLCNNSTPAPTSLTGGLVGYPVTIGFDLVTGWGSIDVNNFLKAASASAGLAVSGTTLTGPAAGTITQTVKFTATVSGAPGATPTGAVQFSSNGIPLGAAVALAGGVAVTPALSFPNVGTFSISAAYSGDSTYSASSAPNLTLVVTNPNAVATTSTLTATATAVTALQPVGFTTTVSGSGGTPTGTVQFLLDGIADGGAMTLTGGSATLAPALLTAGTHVVSSKYSGDNNFAPSTSNLVTITVTSTAIPATVAITVNPTTINTTQTTLVGFTVTGTTGNPTPTGTMTLKYGTTTIGALPLANGTVTGVLGPLPAGTYPLFGTYSGDSVYAGANSPISTLTVTVQGAGQTIALTPASNSLTFVAGSTTANTDAVTVTSSNFVGVQSLSCSIQYNGPGTPAISPTCSFNPATVTFTASGTMNALLTISTIAPRAANQGNFSSNRRIALTGAGGATLCILFAAFVPRRKRRFLTALRLLSAAFFLAGTLASLSGCGSGTNSSVTPVPGTTPGSYDATISANSNLNQPGNVGYSTTVQLTIQ